VYLSGKFNVFLPERGELLILHLQDALQAVDLLRHVLVDGYGTLEPGGQGLYIQEHFKYMFNKTQGTHYMPLTR